MTTLTLASGRSRAGLIVSSHTDDDHLGMLTQLGVLDG